MNHNTPPRAAQTGTANAEAIEARLALHITSLLSQGTDDLSHDIAARLRFSRERALAGVRHQRRQEALAPATSLHAQGRAAALGGPPSVWLRLASALPIAVLVVGLVLIQQYHDHEQIAAAAEIDSALLADELPPTAYRDPGFSEFLRSSDAP